MWVMTNFGFYSTVQHDASMSERHPDLEGIDTVLVRTRDERSVQALAEYVGRDYLTTLDTADYGYRVQVSKAEWAEFLADVTEWIDYNKFKPSVANKRLRSAYMAVWGVLLRLQPYGRGLYPSVWPPSDARYIEPDYPEVDFEQAEERLPRT